MKNIISRYFTLHLKNVLSRSQRLTETKKGVKEIGIEELFKAIVWENGSVGFNMLKNLKTFSRLRKSISQIGPLDEKKSNKTVSFSKKADAIIVNAVKIAQEFRFPYVGTEHLLFALLENGDKTIFSLLGKDKIELKYLMEQLQRIMNKSTDISDEPLLFINYPKKTETKNAAAREEGSAKQEFLQEVMGEISELFSSLLEKKKRGEVNSPPPGFFQPSRPPFGLIMPHLGKQEQFLEYFGHDLNKEVIQGKVDLIVGRNKEIDDAICILMRKSKNNPVLIGEPGVGKTAIVAGLAKRIVEKEVPPALVGKRIVSLDLGLLVAGTAFRGEFEDRFKRVINEAESDPDIILFVDELHNLIGAGSAQGSLDAANILKPALARGLLRCIGATTIEEYHRYIEKDGALERRFQSVWVKEPTIAESLKILKGIKRFYEEHHNVKISNRAISKAVKLADRYITDRFLPDKAIDLLDESAAFVVQDEHRQGTTKKLHKFQAQKEKLCQLKEKMVRDNNMEMAASLLQSEKDLQEMIKELEKRVLAEKQFIPVVEEQDVFEVVSRKLSLPLELIMENPTERLKNLPSKLRSSLRGQDKAIEEVTATLKRLFVGIADPERPATALLFVGPTGVGKTYFAKLIAKELFFRPDSLIRIDMSEFNEKHTVSRLLGSPPGYVGYGDANSFTDKVRKNPYSLILFDEIEKAHPEVFHILLQVLEDGFLTDGTGRKINFRNSIIIFTSNLGNDEFLKKMVGFSEKNSTPSKVKKYKKTGIRKKLEDFLRPEFLNRLSGIVFFKPLGLLEMKEIAVLEIEKLRKRLLKKKKIKLKVEKKVVESLAKKSINEKEGVRMLRRMIQRKIEEPVACEILEGRLTEGSQVFFTTQKTVGKNKAPERFKLEIILAAEPKIVGFKENFREKSEPAYAKQPRVRQDLHV